MATASDYDARRVSDVEAQDRSALRELATTLPGSSTAIVDDDPNVVRLLRATRRGPVR